MTGGTDGGVVGAAELPTRQHEQDGLAIRPATCKERCGTSGRIGKRGRPAVANARCQTRVVRSPAVNRYSGQPFAAFAPSAGPEGRTPCAIMARTI